MTLTAARRGRRRPTRRHTPASTATRTPPTASCRTCLCAAPALPRPAPRAGPGAPAPLRMHATRLQCRFGCPGSGLAPCCAHMRCIRATSCPVLLGTRLLLACMRRPRSRTHALPTPRPHARPASAHAAAVLRRARLPAGRARAAQAIERDAHGRKLTRGKHRRALPAYFRIIRPASGHSPTDMHANGAVMTPGPAPFTRGVPRTLHRGTACPCVCALQTRHCIRQPACPWCGCSCECLLWG